MTLPTVPLQSPWSPLLTTTLGQYNIGETKESCNTPLKQLRTWRGYAEPYAHQSIFQRIQAYFIPHETFRALAEPCSSNLLVNVVGHEWTVCTAVHEIVLTEKTTPPQNTVIWFISLSKTRTKSTTSTTPRLIINHSSSIHHTPPPQLTCMGTVHVTNTPYRWLHTYIDWCCLYHFVRNSPVPLTSNASMSTFRPGLSSSEQTKYRAR